jgi:hypothetical protein
MALHPLRRRYLTAPTLAVLPYLAFNVWWIISATGSIVHMSKAEWAIWTMVSTLGLWLVCAAVLAVSGFLTKNNAWLSAALSLTVFVGVGIAISPYIWDAIVEPENAPHLWESLLFQPFDNGIGPSLVVTGLLSVIFVVVLARVRPADRFS